MGEQAAARVWILADDRTGNVSQCLGVAEQLGWPYEIKQIRYDLLGSLPNLVRRDTLMGLTQATRDALGPPWPPVVIAAGRRTAPVARWLKKQSGCFLVQMMDPGGPGRADFDLIAVSTAADPPRLPNVMPTLGAPHRVTAERLAAEADAWRPRFSHLPRPWLAVVVGGKTHSRRFPVDLARRLGEQASALAAAAGGSVLLTTSRRTGRAQEQALADAVAEPHYLHLWSRKQGGDNPFFGMLALADATVVTGDSVSMCCEACSATAPVYVYAPEGWCVPKHERLHQELYERGLARPFDTMTGFEPWTHAPLNPAADIAAAVRARLGG